MKQTAVEWLYETIDNELINFLESRIDVNELSVSMLNAKQQSKAMEREQIEDAHIEGQRVFDKHDHTQWTTDQAEQYYNETYGK